MSNLVWTALRRESILSIVPKWCLPSQQKVQCRQSSLDLLRLSALALVLLSHAGQASGQSWAVVQFENGRYDFSFGHIGVTLFIILSGLSLHLSQQRHVFTSVEFYRRRVLRIYPTYWMALIATLALGAVLH